MELEKKQEIASNFLIAEYNALQAFALSIEQRSSMRVNFFLGVVTATGAGLLAAASIERLQIYFIYILELTLLGIFLLGNLTLWSSINYAATWVGLSRRAGKIRCWFVDLHNEIINYTAFDAADDRPYFPSKFTTSRGGEISVSFINVVAITIAAGILFYQIDFYPLIITPIGSFVILISSWILQRWVVKNEMKKFENSPYVKSQIKFPYEKRYMA